eukprot:5558287-Amphidinium_carterae.1
MATSECNRRILSSDGAFHAQLRLIVRPENKATALLISHCQRPDTCKKPGTAFTTEYQIPGTAVTTLVQDHSTLLAKGIEQQTMECAVE